MGEAGDQAPEAQRWKDEPSAEQYQSPSLVQGPDMAPPVPAEELVEEPEEDPEEAGAGGETTEADGWAEAVEGELPPALEELPPVPEPAPEAKPPGAALADVAEEDAG